jgi:hypothetical protein
MPGKPACAIDVNQLEKLAALHCTIDEAAAFFGCCKRTMLRYLDETARDPIYREAWERGRQNGKSSLRRLQWKHANGTGSSAVTMTIHLSKHWLGETEKSLVEMTGRDGGPVAVQPERSAREVVEERLAALAERMQATNEYRRSPVAPAFMPPGRD